MVITYLQLLIVIYMNNDGIITRTILTWGGRITIIVGCGGRGRADNGTQ